MAKTGTIVRSKKQQRIAAELRCIIDEMDYAMWNADKEYVAAAPEHVLTPRMNETLCKFQEYCMRYRNEKA